MWVINKNVTFTRQGTSYNNINIIIREGRYLSYY